MPPNPERLFRLPREGEVSLPPIEQSNDTEAETILLNAVTESGRANDFLELVPDRNFWSMDFGKGGKMYVKPFLQRTLYMDKPRESHVLYAMDLNGDKRIMGLIFSVRHTNSADEKDDVPFVGYNQTRTGFYNLGLGLRRLLVLNEMSKQIYGEKLTSSEFIYGPEDKGNPAIIIWERLVRAGLAEKTGSGYRFIK